MTCFEVCSSSIKFSHSLALLKNFILSLNHCTAEPPTNTLPSKAYVVFPPIFQAIVETNPCLEVINFSPEFISKKQPVPYVTFPVPYSWQHCPNKAAC